MSAATPTRGSPSKTERNAQGYLSRAIDIEETRETERIYDRTQLDLFIDAPDPFTPDELDDLKEDAAEVDSYGRVTRTTLPVNIDGDFVFPVTDVDECEDELGRCSYTGRVCLHEDECLVDKLDADGPFERDTEGPCCGLDESEDYRRDDLVPYRSESTDTYLNLPLQGRVANQGAPHIYDTYYEYNRNEVLDVGWNGCGESIEAGDLYLTHCGKAFCSTLCVEDFKCWQTFSETRKR